MRRRLDPGDRTMHSRLEFANEEDAEVFCRGNSSNGSSVRQHRLATTRSHSRIPDLLLPRASAATVARIPYIHTLADQKDFLYSTTDVAIWSCSETGLAITAACCATLRPLIRNYVTSSSIPAYNNNSKSRSNTVLSGGRPAGASQGKNSHWVGGTHSGSYAGRDNIATEELQLDELQNGEVSTEPCPRPSIDSAVPCDFFRREGTYIKEFPSKG